MWKPGDRIFNVKELQARLLQVEPEECDDGFIIRRIFIGTVFKLYPSGKFYTTYAHSNVDSSEVDLDVRWRDQAEDELDEIGGWIENGEGDSCDLFVAQESDYVKEVTNE